MRISAISTMTDWTNLHGANGPVGIARIMDWLNVARIDTVYWRAFNGGLAKYPSKVAGVFTGRKLAQSNPGAGGGPISRRFFKYIDFNEFDQLQAAIQIGHDYGIKVYAWFTLCEEDHGGPHLSPFGQESRFRKHDREGRDYLGTVDFFYPEVQQYKLKLLDEVLERDPAGILLDFVRSNATSSGDSDGIHRFGYNPEIRAAFQKLHGVDPLEIRKDDRRWIGFKQDYLTKFVRAIKAHAGANRPISIMAIPHVDNPRWMCLDLPQLTREGTVSHVMGFGMGYDPSPQRVVSDYQCLRNQVKGKATVAAGVQAYDGIDPEAFDRAVAAADRAGAKELVLYEADALVGQELLASVRAVHLGAPRRTRDVVVKSVRVIPKAGDWKKTRQYSGFFMVEGADKQHPTAQTWFSVLRSPSALHVRVVCEGTQTEINPKRFQINQVYIDWLRAKLYWLYADRAHVFLDLNAGRREFVHFVAGRQGECLQGKRFDGAWKAKWKAHVNQASDKCWEVVFDLPFRSLGRRPRQGERWGFQIIREQAATREASGWCVSTGRILTPRHWGDLVFA